MKITKLFSSKKIYKIALISMIILYHCTSSGQSIIKKYDPVPFFTNRNYEITDLSDQLKKYRTVGVIGVTNIGKTELARQYSNVNRNKYHLIWFFDTSVDLNEQFSLLAHNINKNLLNNAEIKISEHVANSRKEVINFLNQQEKWLLVFDNLKINSNYCLQDILNWSHKGHIIICSQDDQYITNKIKIHKMNKQHSIQLLQKILKLEDKNKEKDLLEDLAKAIDGYPGMIVNSAFLLKEHKYLTMEEYKNILLKSDDPMKKHMEILLNILSDKDKQLLICIASINNQFFSKKLLNTILSDNYYVGEGIYNLMRFALIKQIEEKNGDYFFEMHESIKDGLLKIYSDDQIKESIYKTITILNSSFPKGVTSRQEFIKNDPSIKSNLEVLLDNAEKYKIDINTILELRKNLIDHYTVYLDYYNVELMRKWLDKNSEHLHVSKMNNYQKTNYGWYLVNIGIYEDFANSNFIEAIKYFKKAYNTITSVSEASELKSTILMQMAQTQAYGGEIQEAKNNIDKVSVLIKDYPDADYDMGLYWYIKAKILLMEGKYQQALDAVEQNIKAESHMAQDVFTAPTYILKSEILNYQEQYKNSYRIIKKIVEQEKDSGFDDHEVKARMLTQLSRAELGLGQIDSAFINADEACKILQNNQYNNSANINVEYAAALVAKADVLLYKSMFTDAMQAYSKAEAVYLNRYGNHYYNVDDVAYLLFQGVCAASKNKNNFWKKHFCKQIQKFNNKNYLITKALIYCN